MKKIDWEAKNRFWSKVHRMVINHELRTVIKRKI